MDMSVAERYGCAILAGGAGKRMGQVNKAELDLDGRSFLACVCSELEKTGMKGLISIANHDQVIPEGWTAIRDSVTGSEGEFIGPMGGICSCLKQAEKDGLEGLFFAPCDAPFYKVEIIRVLAEEIDRSGQCDAVILRTPDGRLQTAFGWYSVNCIEGMERLIAGGSYKVRDALDRLRTIVIDTADLDFDDKILSNINSIDDYTKLMRDM